jgi:hypothetical protein
MPQSKSPASRRVNVVQFTPGQNSKAAELVPLTPNLIIETFLGNAVNETLLKLRNASRIQDLIDLVQIDLLKNIRTIEHQRGLFRSNGLDSRDLELI